MDEKRYAKVREKAESDKPGSGHLAELEARWSDVNRALYETTGNDTDSLERHLELEEAKYKLEQRISEEKERQAEIERQQADMAEQAARAEEESEMRRAEAQANWERNMQFQQATDEERLQMLNREIELIRQRGRSAETEEQLRAAITQRTDVQGRLALKKEQEEREQARKAEEERKRQEEFHRKKSEFVYGGGAGSANNSRLRNAIREAERNGNDANANKLRTYGTDSQKMRGILGQLETARASGDQEKMLELMMAGAEIANQYDEPKNLHEQRMDAKAQKREAKRAAKQARKMRSALKDASDELAGTAKGGDWMHPETLGREAYMSKMGWVSSEEFARIRGVKSSKEKAADITAAKDGVPSEYQMKDGKVVKVEGVDRTNQLLAEVVKSLA